MTPAYTAMNMKFKTILADPPWRFNNRGIRPSPTNKKCWHYPTMSIEEIAKLSIPAIDNAHLYLWVPNALLPDGLFVMHEWGFDYKTNLVWCKVRKDNQPHSGGCGFYFRTATELLLFGTRGKLRTKEAGRRQINIFCSQKREHSRKPDEFYDIIESCSPGPYLELFARSRRPGWTQWGNEVGKFAS
jgi:N6-adenosine-specific RNA methylase IME4